MDDQNTQGVTDNKKPRRWARRLYWLAGVVLVILAIALIYDATGRQQFEAVLQEIRDSGEPVTFQEIQAARKVWPDDENGAHIIESLADRLEAITKDNVVEELPLFSRDDYRFPLGQRWSSQTLAVVNTLLADHRPMLTEINRLKDFEGGRFSITVPENPITIELDHFSKLRTSAKLKALDAVHKVMDGRTEEVTNDIAVILGHSRLLADEPFLISALVNVAIDNLTIDTIERICAQTELSDAQLAEISDQLSAIDHNDCLYWGMLGERSMFLGAGTWLREKGTFGEGIDAAELPVLHALPGIRGWLLRDQAYGLRLETHMVEATRKPREALKIAQEQDKQSQELPYRYVITRTLLPSLGRAFAITITSDANIRCAQTALAAERYRLKNGDFPTQLAELVPDFLPAVPTDPFDQQPLRYVRTDGRVVIYSINDDETDDGGDVKFISKEHKPKDAGFVLLPVAARGIAAPPETQASQPQ